MIQSNNDSVKTQLITLYCYICKTACRSILAGAAVLAESFNVSSGDASTLEQRDEQLAANSNAACKFLEDIYDST